MRRYAISALMAAITTLVVSHQPASIAQAPAPAPTTTSSTTSTTSSTTTSTSTTTTTTIPAGNWLCPEWVQTALNVGFPIEQLSTVDKIMHRESTCRPHAYNGADPNGGSRGLMQINGVWCNWFLPDRGIITTCDDLFDPTVNLSAAYAIWQHSGWQPWGF